MSEPLTTTIFEGWMRKIMERFDRNEQLICALTGKELKEVHYLDGERLLDNQDLYQMLHSSERSLQRHRTDGTLKYCKLKGKVYYKESDVADFVKYHFAESELKKQQAKDKQTAKSRQPPAK